MLAVFYAFLWGCTPEAKTIVLQDESPRQTADAEDSGADFTVKKIYAYDYETQCSEEVPSGMMQSAFLKNCDENEIRVWVQGDEESDSYLKLREVDYRYGFYEEIGAIPVLGYGAAEIRCCPSQDGEKMLVYWCSEERLQILLYDLKAQKQILLAEHRLYGDEDLLEKERKCWGAWSESGRWMTYDVLGTLLGGELTAVLDTEDEALQTRFLKRKTEHNTAAASLLEGEDGRVGLLEEVWYDGDPDTAYFFLNPLEEGDELRENSAGDDPLEGECFVRGFGGAYEADTENGLIYSETDIDQIMGVSYRDQSVKGVYDFDSELLFWRKLEDGGFLAALCWSMETFDEVSSSEFDAGIEGESDPAFELYCYSEEEEEENGVKKNGERMLLYKGSANLIGMDYDPDTKRILLETVLDPTRPEQRRCIILEM